MRFSSVIAGLVLALLIPAVPARAQLNPATNGTTDRKWVVWETGLLVGGQLILKHVEPTSCRWCGPTSLDGGLTWAPTREHAADVTSSVLLASALAIEMTQIGREKAGRTDRILNGARTLALATAIAEVVKIATARERPDKSDAVSFVSEHTAIVSAALVASIRHGGAKKALLVTAPLTMAVGYLRIAAGKHWTTDVLAGAAAGAAIGMVTP